MTTARKFRQVPIALLALGSGGSMAQTLPIQAHEHLVFVRVRVGGSRPLWFNLDSGASWSIVDKKVAARLGLRSSGHSSGHGAGQGTYDMAWCDDVSFDLGFLSFKSRHVAIIDLSGPQHSTGHPMDGILGYDFLRSHVVQVDYEHGRLTIFEPTTRPPKNLGFPIDITFRRNLATIPVNVEAGGTTTTVHPLVDSGSSDGLDDDLFSKTGLVKKTVTGGVGLGNTFAIQAGNWSAVTIGNQRMEGVTAASGGSLIGGEVLHRFTVTFDYPHAKIWLRPNRALKAPFPTPR